MLNSPNFLVTIGVLSYNSESTILETLDSAKNQSYSNIELIICDDGSKDKTLSLVNKWLDINKDSFISAGIISVESNTGTPANCNRLLKKAKGEWLKIIAADDILLPNCIEDFATYIFSNPTVSVVYSNYNSFMRGHDGTYIIKEAKIDKYTSQLFDTDPINQLYIYLEKGFNISPATFMNTNFARKIGFIEKYKVFEDTPFYVRVLMGGTKIYHLDKDTVLYRCDGDSVTRDKNKKFFYKQTYVDNLLLFKEDLIYPLYPWYKLNFWIKEYSFRVLYYIVIKLLDNKRTKINNIIYYCLKAINPYYLSLLIAKKLCR